MTRELSHQYIIAACRFESVLLTQMAGLVYFRWRRVVKRGSVMRQRLLIAACAALCLSSEASSATVVTSTNVTGTTPSLPGFPSGLKAFDSSLGMLTGITLQVSGGGEAGYNVFVTDAEDRLGNNPVRR